MGSILGALVTGFALLPALGSEAVCRLYVFVLMAVALLLVLPGVIGAREPAPSRRPLWQAAGLLVLAIGVAQLTARQPAWDALRLTSGANVYFRASHVVEDSRLLFWHEDLFGGITTVIENAGADSQLPSRILLTNGKFQGNDSGEAVAQIGFALIPLLQQPRRGRALVIGLGTGHSAAVVAAAGFERVEIAEISPGIVQAAASHFGHLNQGVLERDNVELHLEDGRNVLLRSDRRYDLITMELTSIP